MSHDHADLPRNGPTAPHSGLGIASFIIAVAAGCLVIANLMYVWDKPAKQPAPAIENLACGSCLVCGPFQILGLILGIIGACRRGTRKLFAWLGISINAGLLLGLSLLICYRIYWDMNLSGFKFF